MKRKMNHIIRGVIMVLCVLLAVGCNKDESLAGGEPGTLPVRLADNRIHAARRYYTLRFDLSGIAPEDSVLNISCDAPWLRLTSDNLYSDGVTDVFAEANLEHESRKALIRISSRKHADRYVVIELEQEALGLSSNAEEDYTITFCLGYGFSVFDEYRSQNSVKSRILNESALMKYSSDSTFSIIQENMRGMEEIEYISAYSLMEMSHKMTQKSTSSTSFLGFRKTTTRLKEVTQDSVKEQCYGYGRMSKTVASRNIDVGALIYLTRHPEVVAPEELFSAPFYRIYEGLRDNKRTQAERTKLICDMLDEFGTHLVVRASLGGYIDYCFTLDKQNADNPESSVSSEVNKVFGKIALNTPNNVSSVKNSEYSFNVVGGSEDARDALLREIQGMSDESAFTSSSLQDWLQSITKSVLNSSNRKETLGVIDFRFIPIWDLFPNDISRQIIAEVIARTNETSNSFSEREIGADFYAIDLRRHGLLSFGEGKDASLVKVMYKDNKPICEICSEYVPKVRSDRRINVIYPIKDGRPQIMQGIFPGDGEGNRPATLSFADGDVYVNPMMEYSINDVLDTLYFAHGNLYAQDHAMPYMRNARLTVEDYYLQFQTSSLRYPVVKIGCGYWTRCPIKESMGWGYIQYNSITRREEMRDGILFAQTFDQQDDAFFVSNDQLYGFRVNSVLGMRDKWYLPSTYDRNSLMAFLGHNHKALFAGQQSGFEADFSGCLGWKDPFNPDNWFVDSWGDPTQKHVYKGEYCFISFRDVTHDGSFKVSGASLLVLSKDYTWKQLEVERGSDFAYPIRLFRTAAYCYPDK